MGKKMKTKIFRLKDGNGTDIIGQVYENFNNESGEANFYTVVEPLEIVYVATEHEMEDDTKVTMSIMFHPWFLRGISKHGSFKIYCDDILTSCKPTKEIKTMYEKVVMKLLEIEENTGGASVLMKHVTGDMMQDMKDNVESMNAEKITKKKKTILH